MFGFVYSDEDNAPMTEDAFNGYHNPTVYGSRAEMKAVESGWDAREREPDKGCWNCLHYDPSREACTKEWNNADPDFYLPDRDDRKPDEWCEDWVIDKSAVYDDFFTMGGNEP